MMTKTECGSGGLPVPVRPALKWLVPMAPERQSKARAQAAR
ncbi:hypothetical protein [Breoghania sp.]|nr:hypothetical protein [Breoghania sp.]MDJ0933697.1 hypothetical protein [Breoghania sp.]